jgi:hypothetical protein
MKIYKTLRWLLLLTGLAGCAGLGGHFEKIDKDRYAFMKKSKGQYLLLFEIKADSLYDYQER